MPIFAYRCQSCGFEKDVLQKRSDPLLVDCPACSRATFARQLTAPAFQLKGSGWYVTDFRDNGKGKSKPAESAESGSAAPPGDGIAGKSGSTEPGSGKSGSTDTGGSGAVTPANTGAQSSSAGAAAPSAPST